MERNTKKIRQAISLETKIEILNRIAKGERYSAIGKHFKLRESSVRTIKKNEAKIRNSVSSGTHISSKLSSYSRDLVLEKTERALIQYIEDLTAKKIPISGYLISQKALLFYEQIKNSFPATSFIQSKKFSASNGWLYRFLKRNAFHNVMIRGETASADENSAKMYPETLKKIIEDGGYSSHQVFNADETGLYWKKMPSRTYIAKSEKRANGFKVSKDRITFMLCSNASGDRMLKPLVVNKSLRPRALKGKNLKQLPVHWMANSKAWVTTSIFTDWFYTCFVPEVKCYMKDKNLEFKALLIVDNAPGHPHLEHPNVNVIFLPPNTTSILQPLDQGIISTFKKYYIKHTYKFILKKIENESLALIDAWKKYTIFDCIVCASSAISDIRPQTLNACWKALWPQCILSNEETENANVSDDIVSLARQIGSDGFNEFCLNDIEELIVEEPLSDDEIVSNITTSNVQNDKSESDEETCTSTSTTEMFREILKTLTTLQNQIIRYETDTEKALKLNRELNNLFSGYREQYNKSKQSVQKLLTNYFVSTQQEKNCENTTMSTTERIFTFSSDDNSEEVEFNGFSSDSSN